MIITRTPFRIPLGGGSTDLPSYYERFGGFIFGAAVNLYMYIGLNRPPSDDKIRFKYSQSEEVDRPTELKHQIGRAALQHLGLEKGIEVISVADVPEGTGMGSSGSYAVGLLHALRALKRDYVSVPALAEEGCHLLMNVLKLPDGKQDPYLAALGGLQALEIARDGTVRATALNLPRHVIEDFEHNALLFYTGVRRPSAELLTEQHDRTVAGDEAMLSAKHKIKEIGIQIRDAFSRGDLAAFGRLMDDHWQVKRSMSSGMSSAEFDRTYDLAKSAGAIGGKLVGAGGGGLFLFYAEGDARGRVRATLAAAGLREIPFRIDFEGTKVIADHISHRDSHHFFT